MSGVNQPETQFELHSGPGNDGDLDGLLGGASRKLLRAGLVALALLAAGFLFDREQFFQSYLTGYLYALGFGMGCFGVMLLHNLTGGAWGDTIRPLLEAGTRTIPFLGLLAIPVLLGIHDLYEWSHADVVAHDPILSHKAVWLNTPFFVGRTVFYFAVWTAVSRLVLRVVNQTRLGGGSGELLRRLSAAGLLIYVLTMTFAAFDWGMSLEPHWFSTIYGMHFVVGQALTAFSFGVLVAAKLRKYAPWGRFVSPGQVHDLGNLMFAFTMLWAYVSFSQFLIIWSGNLPEETPWYLHRTNGGWQVVTMCLVAFHFAAPFLLLLHRNRKRNVDALARIAVLILVLRYVDFLWLVSPAKHPATFHLSLMDLLAPIGLFGVWCAAFLRELRRAPVLPEQERLAAKNAQEAHA